MRFSLFKSLVMLFRLSSAPTTFQRFINNILRLYLDLFYTAYLDDILIYSQIRKEYIEYLKKVLQALREASLFIQISKCKFYKEETTFLSLIVGRYSIKIDLKKVKTIQNQEILMCLANVQAFIRFSNFYYQFIQDFLRIITLIVQLTQKGVKFIQDQACEKLFQELKRAFIEALILTQFDQDKEIILETDASDYVSASVLSQYRDNRILRPIVFFSKKYLVIEYNYKIYNKELLAIIYYFKEQRLELESTVSPI